MRYTNPRLLYFTLLYPLPKPYPPRRLDPRAFAFGASICAPTQKKSCWRPGPTLFFLTNRTLDNTGNIDVVHISRQPVLVAVDSSI